MAVSKQCVVALLAIAVAALTRQSRAAPATLAATPLDAHAIRTAVVQNTLSLPTESGGVAQAYVARRHVLRGTYGGQKVKGRWSLRGNRLCLHFPHMRESGCWRVLRYQDGRLQLFNASGTPAGDLGVSKGNPYNF